MKLAHFLRKTRDGIDRLLAIVKWPCAVLMALLLPLTLWVCGRLILRIASTPLVLVPFVAGAMTWLAIWMLVKRWRLTFLLTLEHELTHALFAWLTLHRVLDLKVTLRRGGQIRYVGRGNWLITIAPYFWPTASLTVIALLWFLPTVSQNVADVLLGMSFAWHVTGTVRETSSEQPDIRKVGPLFAWLFLPTANLLATAFIIAFAHQGPGGCREFAVDLFNTCQKIAELL